MAYEKDGFVKELANKVGHVKLIQDPMIRNLVEAFEDTRPIDGSLYPQPTGSVDLERECPIAQVITVDGSHQAVPNILRPERQVGFVQVASHMIKMETVDYLRINPMCDPRQVQQLLGEFTHHILAVLPVVGVIMPGLSLKDSVRAVVHRFIEHYGLYDALAYLVYREWEQHLDVLPSMDCVSCGSRFELPTRQRAFNCPSCKTRHTLSDYLGLLDHQTNEQSTAETVSNFRTVLEALALFSVIIRFQEHDSIMGRTLFLLDGPLILRAQLSRLVEPIRALIQHRKGLGKPLFLVGVEKSGEMRDFASVYSSSLVEAGEYFIPSSRFVVEEINGRPFDADTYRNRVNYGAKVLCRLGPDHVIVLTVPTGDFLQAPAANELLGLEAIVRFLSRLVSYQYPNALIPLVLANAAASISNEPSGSILRQFVDRILDVKT